MKKSRGGGGGGSGDGGGGGVRNFINNSWPRYGLSYM